ncbi:hypothetical protein QJQ45_025401, partial [Haematococcus lacustris]
RAAPLHPHPSAEQPSSRTALNSRHASRWPPSHAANVRPCRQPHSHADSLAYVQPSTLEQQPSAARSSGQQTAEGNSQDVQQGGSSRSRRHKSYGAAT